MRTRLSTLALGQRREAGSILWICHHFTNPGNRPDLLDMFSAFLYNHSITKATTKNPLLFKEGNNSHGYYHSRLPRLSS